MTRQLHPPEVVAEMERNRKAYEAIREQMERKHWNKVALMHDGVVVAIYNDHGDAYMIGCEKFGLGKFSLHIVGQQPVDFGFHSVLLGAGQ